LQNNFLLTADFMSRNFAERRCIRSIAQKAFGAPISDAGAKDIAAYLAANYGT
jgi:hypothetical protein